MTVDSGILRCKDDAVTFDAGGKTYALNGTAIMRKAGINIQGQPIWADNPNVPGLKKTMVLIDDGLALCN